MKLSRSILLCLPLLLPTMSSAQIAPSSDDGPTFFGPEVQLNLNADEIVTVERKEDITPGTAPIVVDSETPLPHRPDSHILHEARVFTPEEHARLSTLLKDKSHGIEFYVTAHTILPSDSLENYALKVRDAWAQTESCIIFCYQRGTQLMTMCSSDGIYHFLPKPELARSYEKAYAAAGKYPDAAGRLNIAVETFLTDVSDKITKIKQNNVVFDRGIVRILIALSIALAIAGAIGVFLSKMQNKASIQNSTIYQFPLLDIPRRLNAPFGGGMIAEVIFETPAPSTKR